VHFGGELFFYAAIAGDFKEGWIPESYFHRIVIPNTAGKFSSFASLKTLSKKIFTGDEFPDAAYANNGKIFDKHWKLLSEKDTTGVLFSATDKVVFKPNSSCRGRGIVVFDKNNFDIESVRQLSDGVFQAWIEQHSDFSSFGIPSTATLRLVTTIDHMGYAKFRGAYLRLGRAKENHVSSDTGIRIPVTATGHLSPVGYLSNWDTINKHPDSDVPFLEVALPKFSECINVCKRLHETAPFIHSIGWDLCVDTVGKVKIMEYNIAHDIKFLEAVQGPCFADMGWEKLWQKNS